MVFSCKNCGKRYRIEPSLYEIHPVRFICRKCAQEHIIHKADDTHEAVVAVGSQGGQIRSTTRELSTILVKSDLHSNANNNVGTSDAWYITVMGQRQGPLTRIALLELLTTKKITSRTFVWRAPMGSWVRLKDLAELADLLAEAERAEQADNEKTVIAKIPEFKQESDSQIRPPSNPFDNPADFQSSASSASRPESVSRQRGGGPGESSHRKPWAKQQLEQSPSPSTAASDKGGLADELFKGLDSPRIDIRRASEVQDEEPLIVPISQRRHSRQSPGTGEFDKTQITWAYHDDEAIMPPAPRPTDALELHELGHLANKLDNAHRRKVLVTALVIGILAAIAIGGTVTAVILLSPDKTDTYARVDTAKLKKGGEGLKANIKKSRALPDTAIFKTLKEPDEVQNAEGTDVIKATSRGEAARNHAAAMDGALNGGLPTKQAGTGDVLLVQPKVRTSTQELARVNSDVKSDYARYGKLLESGTGHVDKEVKIEPKTVTGMGNQQMDSKKINDFFLGKMGQFRGCRNAMSRQVDSTIDINLSFTLMKSGQISNLVIVPVGVHDPKLVQCMKSIVAGWMFPQQGSDTEFRTKFGI